MPLNKIGVLYRRIGIGQQIAQVLVRKKIPFQWQQDKRHTYAPGHDSIKPITMHSSEGLESSLVGIPAVGAAPGDNGTLQEEARLLYVAMTRATDHTVITHGSSSVLITKKQRAMGVLQG